MKHYSTYSSWVYLGKNTGNKILKNHIFNLIGWEKWFYRFDDNYKL